MARRRFRRTRARFAGFARKYRRSARTGGLTGSMGVILGGGAYGALRARLAGWVQPISANLPLGNISDEVVLGAAMMLGKRMAKGKIPMLNNVLSAGLAIESARIGEALSTGQAGFGGGSNMANNQQYLYG